MAKKLGKKNKKKGLDGRDFAVIGGYIIFVFIIIYLYAQASSGNKEVKKLEKQEAQVKREFSEAKKASKDIAKRKKQIKIELDVSESKYKREEEEYTFVVGTSLEYAKKNKLMMAVWEAIDRVRSIALRYISVEKNNVKLELFTQSDVFLTEFMSELNKRKDLIRTIQITETKTEKIGKKKEKEALVGYMSIVAKRPGGTSVISSQKDSQGRRSNPQQKDVSENKNITPKISNSSKRSSRVQR
tara:strand:- start:2077 stop:2805 length:729 start_codon:yes stop_codon:yes gene_type:complete